MKKKYKWMIAALLLLAAAAAYGYTLLQPLPVAAEQVQPQDLLDSFTVQGQVIPENSLVLNAPLSGTLTALPLSAGQRVTAGQPLAQLAKVENSALELQKEQLRQQILSAEHSYRNLSADRTSSAAALQAAQSAYELALRQYEAAQEVARQIPGAQTELELLALENAVKSAEQGLAAAQSDNSSADLQYYRDLIASANQQLDILAAEEAGDGRVLAPYEGVVWQVLAEEGAYVSKNQPLLKLYPAGGMKLQAMLLSEDALGLASGAEAQCGLADGRTFTAQVSFISPVAEQGVSTIGLTEYRSAVELQAADLPPDLGAGQQVELYFSHTLLSEVLTVAATALVPQGSGSGVYVIEQGKARLRAVQSGLRSGGRVEIVDGLSAGEVVISNPYDAGIREGSRVVVAEEL